MKAIMIFSKPVIKQKCSSVSVWQDWQNKEEGGMARGMHAAQDAST